MNKEEILEEINARIESKYPDEKSLASIGRYEEALKLKVERNELEHLLAIIR